MKPNTIKTFDRYYPIFALVFAAFSSMQMKEWDFSKAIYPFFVLSIFFIGGGYFSKHLMKKVLAYTTEELRKKLIFIFLSFYIGTYLIVNISISMVTLVAYLIKGLDMSTFIHNLIAYELPAGNGKLHIYLMVFTIIFLYILWSMATRKETRLKEEKLLYRYHRLKSNVNPHFLFNSLNVLSEMVHDDPKQSDEFIQGLAGIYRYVMENEEKQMVPLSSELDFVTRYFQLQTTRAEGKINLVIEVNETSDYFIIPVALQLLVENAIKHNIASTEKKLTIKIIQEGNELVVSNNLQRKSTFEESTRKGLENLKGLVELQTDAHLHVRETEKEFIVTLPLIRK